MPPMPPLRHILAATDLSEPSLWAVERALALAAPSGAACTVVHALGLDVGGWLRQWLGSEPAPDAITPERLTQQARQRQQAAVEAAIAPLAARQGISPTVRVEEGLATAVLARWLSPPSDPAQPPVDVAVLGARGGGHFAHMVLGSTASRLLRHARCPVLVVRQPVQAPYRRVLLTVDFSPASSPTVAAVQRLAPQADCVWLHTVELPAEGLLRIAGVGREGVVHLREAAHHHAQSAMTRLQQAHGVAAAGTPGAPTTVLDDGEPAIRALHHAQQLGCDLIAVGKHGTHVTEELLLGSTTKHLLFEAACDVLVVSATL